MSKKDRISALLYQNRPARIVVQSISHTNNHHRELKITGQAHLTMNVGFSENLTSYSRLLLVISVFIRVNEQNTRSIS